MVPISDSLDRNIQGKDRTNTNFSKHQGIITYNIFHQQLFLNDTCYDIFCVPEHCANNDKTKSININD